MLLSKIDDASRVDHFHLEPDDECYYFLEYTSGRDYSFSKANSAIANLKKKPSNSHRADYRYKLDVIRKASNTFRGALNEDWLRGATLVPVPGSKAIGHVDYDNRIEQICRGIGSNLDVRNLVVQRESTEASHEAIAGARLSVEDLLDIYQIDENIAQPPPTDIAVFDDVLTAGTHFRAMKTLLNRRFPGVRVTGMFIARRVFP
jgi:predicted amidophosphoribosyltransferase